MKTLKVDVAIIGAGTSGMSAYRSARDVTDSIALIEGGEYGTTCARVGCMPSKLLIAAAEAAHSVERAPAFGVKAKISEIDGRAVMHRVRSERDRFVGFVEEAIVGFEANHHFRGCAHFVTDQVLEVDGHTRIEPRSVVIATGSSPAVPAFFEGIGDRLVVNDDVFDWQHLPRSVAVFGPGVIGLELGQALRRLGVSIKVFGRGGRVGPLSDPAIVDYCVRTLGEEFYLNPDADVRGIARSDQGAQVTYRCLDGQEKTEAFDYILAATGRRPNVSGLGLENTTLPLDEHGLPKFDPFTMQVGEQPVFIAGDVNNNRPLLHEAADEGRIAGQNAARYPDVRAGKRSSPIGIVFSDPQIATIGSPFSDLVTGQYAVGEVSFEDQGRSRTMLLNKGLMHIYGEHGTGLLLGAEIFGPRAEHLAHLLAWCHQRKMTVSEILEMPFYHPVIEEGLRTALRDLNRKLLLGPEPVERCLDCGPGA